jgi:hypothetical protein
VNSDSLALGVRTGRTVLKSRSPLVGWRMSQPEAKLMVRQDIVRRNEILQTFENDLFENLANRA